MTTSSAKTESPSSSGSGVHPNASGRRTPTMAKIVATLGPASQSPETVLKLIEAGVSVFRFNFSHGTLEEHGARLATVRRAAEVAGVPVAVLGDLPGPKIRVKTVAEPGIELAAGEEIMIDAGVEVATAATASRPAVFGCTYAMIAEDVEVGHRVLINDGAVRLLVVGKEGSAVGGGKVLRCRVTTGGLVTTKKGVNLPDSEVRVPSLTDRDRECVAWACAHGIDLLALSFVRTAEEVHELKRLIGSHAGGEKGGRGQGGGGGSGIPVVAKMEKPQAVRNMDAILEAADGIMVARGDLGVEMDIFAVPVAQKRLVEAADAWGKACIVATQMLETMIEKSSPTRAEANDVANAVFDGADAVMLSGETAAGKHPVLAVETMRRIVEAAEAHAGGREQGATPPARARERRSHGAAVAHGVWHIVRDSGAKLVVCWSQDGGTARFLAQMGLRVAVVAYSSSEVQTRRMMLHRGVRPVRADAPASGSLREWNERVDADLVARGWAATGDLIVLMASHPLGMADVGKSVVLHEVGSGETGYMRAEQHGGTATRGL